MSDDIRVLHFITRYLQGGAEETTDNTIMALKEGELNYDLRLGFGAEYDKSRVKELEEIGVDTTCFQSVRHYNPAASLVAVVSVAKYLRQENIDILHTHSTEAGIIGRIAGWMARVPVIVHEIHGDPISTDRNPLLNTSIKNLERLTARFSTRLIVKSELIRETYIDRGIGRLEQYELIYHGVDIDAFQNVQPATIGRSDGEFVVLFVGRLSEGKGIFDLLTAFERLNSETRCPVRLLIAGDGELYEDVTNEVRERKMDNVDVLGYRDDVPQLMAAADVFVLPSYREGTPRVITEARASGLPVIATNIAGIPEQIDDGENGILIEPGNVNELTSALEQLRTDTDLYQSMATRAREDLEKFGIERSATAYRDLYRKLIREYIDH